MALLAFAVLLFSFACGAPAPSESGQSALQKRAAELAQTTILVDTHIDIPYRFYEGVPEDLTKRAMRHDFDYVRAKQGGLNAAFMSIFTPANFQDTGESYDVANALIDIVEGFEREWPEHFAIARSVADVREHFERGVVSLPMGMENGAPVRDLAALQHFYDRGVRYITLTHSRANQIGDSFGEPRKWHGLSPFGEEVVREMNRLGIIVDVSHVSDETARAAIELTTAPPIASHSSCRRFVPGFERNISDELIQKVAAKGGVVMINFASFFARADLFEKNAPVRAHIADFLKQHALTRNTTELREYETQYRTERDLYADVTDIVDHIEHVIDLVGVDHVGLGSDFDGLGAGLPEGLKDVSAYPNIVYHLLERGHSEADIAKICGENLLRVWGEVEKRALE